MLVLTQVSIQRYTVLQVICWRQELTNTLSWVAFREFIMISTLLQYFHTIWSTDKETELHEDYLKKKGLVWKGFLCYSLPWIHNSPDLPHSRVFIHIYATFYIGGRNKFVTQRQKLLLTLLLFDFGLGDLHFLWHHMHVSSKTKHFLDLLMSYMGWTLPRHLHY